MKKYLFLGIIAVTTIIGAIAGHMFSSQEGVSDVYNTTLFVTVLSSDSDSSIEEKETASHFFAEAILGWTLSPDFREKSQVDLFSRKQERGNIIFEINSASEVEAKKETEQFFNTLEYKLQQYNNAAKTQFRFLKDDPVITMNTPKKSLLAMAGAVAGLFFGLFAVEGWKIWRRRK